MSRLASTFLVGSGSVLKLRCWFFGRGESQNRGLLWMCCIDMIQHFIFNPFGDIADDDETT